MIKLLSALFLIGNNSSLPINTENNNINNQKEKNNSVSESNNIISKKVNSPGKTTIGSLFSNTEKLGDDGSNGYATFGDKLYQLEGTKTIAVQGIDSSDKIWDFKVSSNGLIALAISKNGNCYSITNNVAKKVIDGASAIEVSDTNEFNLTLSDDGKIGYVISKDYSSVLKIENGKISKKFPIELNEKIKNAFISASSDGSVAYFTSSQGIRNNEIWKFDGTTSTKLDVLNVPSDFNSNNIIDGLWVSKDGSSAYILSGGITNNGDYLIKIQDNKLNYLKLSTSLNLVSDMVLNGDGTEAYLTNGTNTFYINNLVVTKVSGISGTKVSSVLYKNISFSDDLSVGYISFKNVVYQLNGSVATEVSNISVGAGSIYNVEVSADGSKTYVYSDGGLFILKDKIATKIMDVTAPIKGFNSNIILSKDGSIAYFYMGKDLYTVNTSVLNILNNQNMFEKNNIIYINSTKPYLNLSSDIFENSFTENGNDKTISNNYKLNFIKNKVNNLSQSTVTLKLKDSNLANFIKGSSKFDAKNNTITLIFQSSSSQTEKSNTNSNILVYSILGSIGASILLVVSPIIYIKKIKPNIKKKKTKDKNDK